MKNKKQILRSMTGFGRSAATKGDVRALCEIRCLNHRGLDIKCRLPQELLAEELNFRKEIQNQFVRGRVDVSIEIIASEKKKRIRFNAEDAMDILLQMDAFQKKHKRVKPDISFGDLLSARELFTWEESRMPEEEILKWGQSLLKEALADATTTRVDEGKHLKKIVLDMVDICENLIKTISKRLEDASPKYFKDLRKKVAQIVEGLELDDTRMGQEIAHIVQRSDVQEEIQRLSAHMSHFRDLCQAGGAVGRKLDFLCQEMFREANTASSKITQAETTFLVVDLKSEIERIREQVQNIE